MKEFTDDPEKIGIIAAPEGYGVADKKDAKMAVKFHKHLLNYVKSRGGTIPTGTLVNTPEKINDLVVRGFYIDDLLHVPVYGTYIPTGEVVYDIESSYEKMRGYKTKKRR